MTSVFGFAESGSSSSSQPRRRATNLKRIFAATVVTLFSTLRNTARQTFDMQSAFLDLTPEASHHPSLTTSSTLKAFSRSLPLDVLLGGRSLKSEKRQVFRLQAAKKNFGPNGHDYTRVPEDRSRLPVDIAEVHSLIASLVQRRISRDFEGADEARAQLEDLGISLNDRLKLWRADGLPFQQRRYSLAPNVPEEFVQCVNETAVQQLIAQRVRAKQAKDHTAADKVRATLWKMGVDIDDRRRTWRPLGPAGHGFSCRDKEINPSIDIEQINSLLKFWIEAQHERRYGHMDQAIDDLESLGVKLDEVTRQWWFELKNDDDLIIGY